MTYARNSTAALLEMLSYRRVSRSVTEEEFINRFIRPLGVIEDDYGNLWKQVGTSPIMWSSHTDTVHHQSGRQHVHLEGNWAVLSKKERGKCLGADCGGGVWMMTEMIKNDIPGLYIFHRDEETGGQGSQYIAQHMADCLKHIEFAIAFDRKGYGDVITHQMGRTASDAFATDLAAILGGDFKPDPTGLFTDTANYAGIIPECTNLSIGYEMNHGPMERLDVTFLSNLRDKVLTADFTQLQAHREPGEDDDYYGYGYGTHGFLDQWDTKLARPSQKLSWFIQDHPEVVADYLESMCVSVEDLEAHYDGLYIK